MPQQETQDRFSFEKQKPVVDQPVYAWHQVWLAVLSIPGTDTFTRILADPAASAQRGYRWIFITGSVLMTISMIFNPLTQVALLPALLIGSLLGGAFSLVGFIMTNWIIQRIAVQVGGTGTYGNFHYARAAFVAPLNLLNAVLMPFVLYGSVAFSWFSLLLVFVELVMTAIALRAVNQFTWGQALMTTSGFLLLRLAITSVLGSSLVALGGF